MREKLCLALALTHTNEALFPGRFRSRESGLLHHWRLNAPPKPPIFIPRDGVLDDRNVLAKNDSVRDCCYKNTFYGGGVIIL